MNNWSTTVPILDETEHTCHLGDLSLLRLRGGLALHAAHAEQHAQHHEIMILCRKHLVQIVREAARILS